jgi:hypothetical protein
MNKKARLFTNPLVLGLIIFGIAVGPFTRLVSAQANLNEYLFVNDVTVGVETVNDYRQVYYEFQGNKTFITTGPLNSHSPATRGQYITFVKNIQGAGQIFVYHVNSQTTTQLTFASTNLNPNVDREGRVAWEGWVDDQETWQVFYYDTLAMSQLTSGDTSVNPDIDSGFIVFDRHDRLAGLWHTVGYSINEKVTSDLATTIGATEPRIIDRGLELKKPNSIRELVFQDLNNVFELDLPALPLIPNLLPIESLPASDESQPSDDQLTPTPL